MTNNLFSRKISSKAVCSALTIFLLVASIAGAAQTLADQKQTVVFIFGTFPKTTTDGKTISVETALGTGFLVFYPDPRLGDKGFVYLVTARHVLQDAEGKFLPQIKVRLNLRHPDAVGKEYGFIENVRVIDENGEFLWFYSEKPGEDVVVVPFLPDEKKFEFKSIPISMFSREETLKADNVQEGDSLYFIGLMGAYYGTNRNYPVVRRGTLALITPEEINTTTGPQKVFIAELSSWPGNSGSPVFLNISGMRNGALFLGQKLGFLGILLGGFFNRTPVSVVGQPNVPLFLGDSSEIGVSYVLPADRILQVLNGADAQKNRDLQIDQLKHAGN